MGAHAQRPELKGEIDKITPTKPPRGEAFSTPLPREGMGEGLFLLKIKQERSNTFEGWFALALDFYGKLDLCLADAAQVLDVVQLRH